jgi:hypothetical protein
MSARIEILKSSLAKKEALFDGKLQGHIDCVKQANGQPLNDKRNGQATLNSWERQNNLLRSLQESINKTKAAIEKEEEKIALVSLVELPEEIKKLIAAGVLIQWRKNPSFFFVNGVDRARIHLLENGTVAHRYVAEISSKEQYAKFRDVFNGLNRALSSPHPTLSQPESNCPKSAFDPYDTIEQQDFIQKGK